MIDSDSSARELCMALLSADTEDEVIALLGHQGYWDAPTFWRPFGDKPDNFATMGNQSSSADGALVEKLVNSVDAVLMGECWTAGISPTSADAPRSIPEAVAQFFFGDRAKAATLGYVSRWDDKKRREVSDRITLAATGTRQNPSFTVVDAGEGQTPDSMPHTILSLDKQNKINVHFVQGKFNMGGTGALRFCGRYNLQLVISRRNPNIRETAQADASSGQWGFTVVRRENPTGDKRLSTYTYLAPHNGGILRFNADTLPLFPQRNNPYSRDANWGTAIKLYEYKLEGKSHILLPDGLLSRLDILLPEIALPVRLHECRDFKGRSGSFDTTLSGLSVRLSDDRNQNLEPGFPTGHSFVVSGEQMTAEVYAFKRGVSGSYKKSEGIIFAVNGQTHGSLRQAFFTRRSVGMNRLEDSILVILNCSDISGRSREDLFMNSRDRMERGELLRIIEGELETILKENQLLRALRETRKHEDVATKLEDAEPFREALETILQKSPSLASLFASEGPLSNPFRSIEANNKEPFSGKPHPTFFRFRNLEYGRELERTTPVNMRSRIALETDVVNDYFTRAQLPGSYVLRTVGQEETNGLIPDHRLNLENGVATLNLALPKGATVGESFKYQLFVQDETLVWPLTNIFTIAVGPYQKPSGGQEPRDPRHGEKPQGLAIPTAIPVYEAEWTSQGFDRFSALKAVFDPSYEGEDDKASPGSYTYYINMDNIYLNTELKATKESPDIVKSRWQFGMVLVGMALLRDDPELEAPDGAGHENDGKDSITPEDRVMQVTRAIAPVLLPMVEHLGTLSDEDAGHGG